VTVSEVRQFLVSLAGPLEAAGGKQAAADLRRAGDGLAPFADLTVAAFADFLARAQQYAQTGAVPAGGGRGRGPAKAVDADAVRATAEAYRQLYERSVEAGVTHQQIEAELRPLEKLSKDAVLAVAREVGIQKSLKTKKDAVAELRRRVLERKETYERVRHGAEPPGEPVTPSPP
jgi:hypothetical protein